MDTNEPPHKTDVLKSVTSSGVLGKSVRQLNLFEYLLTEKYEGRASKIKAFNIATDIFGRDNSFDSSLDSIVRVEMFRLRAKLKEYSASSEKYELTLPNASYEIQIESKNKTELKGLTKRLASKVRLSSLASLMGIAAFGAISFWLGGSLPPSPECSTLTPNVQLTTQSEDSKLSRYVGNILEGSISQFSHINFVQDLRKCKNAGTPSFEIRYLLFEDKPLLKTSLSAVDLSTGKTLSFRNFSSTIEIESSEKYYFDLIRALNEIIKPYGVLARAANLQDWSDVTQKENYGCILKMYDSFTSDSNEDYIDAINCFERANEDEGVLLDNVGGLISSYIDQAKGVRPKSVDDPLTKASILLDSVGDRWIESVETTIAKMFYEAERRDYNYQLMKTSLTIAEQAYSANPLILIEISKHAGFRIGDWDMAMKISERVKKLHTERDNSVFFIDAAIAVMFENDSASMESCSQTYSENSLLSNLLIAACAQKFSDEHWYELSELNLVRLGYPTIESRIEYIKGRNFDPIFKFKLIDLLQLSAF